MPLVKYIHLVFLVIMKWATLHVWRVFQVIQMLHGTKGFVCESANQSSIYLSIALFRKLWFSFGPKPHKIYLNSGPSLWTLNSKYPCRVISDILLCSSVWSAVYALFIANRMNNAHIKNEANESQRYSSRPSMCLACIGTGFNA